MWIGFQVILWSFGFQVILWSFERKEFSSLAKLDKSDNCEY